MKYKKRKKEYFGPIMEENFFKKNLTFIVRKMELDINSHMLGHQFIMVWLSKKIVRF
jgi:hypothetical protein